MRRGRAERLVAQWYDALVNVAFLATPVVLGRHRRVLMAHAVVQDLEGDSPAALFSAAIKEALVARDAPRWMRIRGLRFFPVSDSVQPLQAEVELYRFEPEVRAAWMLLHRSGLDDAELIDVLRGAAVGAPDDVLAVARRIPVPADQIFDPCAVKLAPEWNRRQQPRLVVPAVLIVLALITAVLVWQLGRDGSTKHQATSTDVSDEVTFTAAAAPDLWRRTSKLDFSAWPARGDLLQDRGLQRRMWRYWQNQAGIAASTGTSMVPPTTPPSILYAGTVDGSEIVVTYDGQRIGRYTEANGRAGLRLDRVDSADLMTSAALVVSRGPQGRRYLLAPWIASSAVRDLVVPDGVSRALTTVNGLTAPVAAGAAGCRSRIVIELRSSPAVAEKHAFVLADLDDLMPTHLTYMPAPHGEPIARPPREVLTAEARNSWALHACGLDAWRNQSARLINNWTFAEQSLPTGGTARWVCLRLDPWAGGGQATIRLETPNRAAQPVAAATNTSACSRFSQNVVAATLWRSPTQAPYLLAAGSRRISHITIRESRGTRTYGAQVAVAFTHGAGVASVVGKETTGKDVPGMINRSLTRSAR
ncbi:hypothetical protein AB0L70_07000 [Kribbella sp. NPDC051952]|uniref:hypothetical protein n=1 Tax=Kribbella sp. NPDC051952 TaxID=3154851 RepID=UPI00344427DB